MLFVLFCILFSLTWLNLTSCKFSDGGYCALSDSGCTLNCEGVEFDLSKLVLRQDTFSKRVLTTTNEDAVMEYFYQFVVPVCGSQPSILEFYNRKSHPSWKKADIWQFLTYGPYYGTAFSLGVFDSTQWSVSRLAGETALKSVAKSGDYCEPMAKNRETTLFLVCDSTATAESPVISLSEAEMCSYELVVGFSDMCRYGRIDEDNSAEVEESGMNSKSTQTEPLLMFWVEYGSMVISASLLLIIIRWMVRLNCRRGICFGDSKHVEVRLRESELKLVIPAYVVFPTELKEEEFV